MFRIALFVCLLVSPSLFAATPPKVLLGSWTGTQESRTYTHGDISGRSTCSLRSIWKLRGASYVWTERVLSSVDGHLLGTRVITLKFTGAASIKTTDGTRYEGYWTHDRSHKKLVIYGRPLDFDADDYDDDRHFQNIIRFSGTSYRLSGDTNTTAVNTVAEK